VSTAPRTPTAYPWQALQRVDRALLGARRTIRGSIDRAVNLGRLAEAASDVLSSPVEIVLRDIAVRSVLPSGQGARVCFEMADRSLDFTLELSSELVAALVLRVLGRAPHLVLSDAPSEPRLAGAIAAIVSEVIRRSEGDMPVRVVPAAAPSSQLLAVAITVRFEGRPYEALIFIGVRDAPTLGAHTEVTLASLGELEVAVPLLVAVSLGSPNDLYSLEPGDAWLPGDGWWVDSKILGHGLLTAPTAEYGVRVRLAENGQLVLGGEKTTIAVDGGEIMSQANDEATQALTETVLEAPIVVRVELGSVSLRAREWAELRPGDVIETGRHIAEPVVLRVAGREVAQGELVNIDGELGVRIRKLYGKATEP